VSPRVSRAWGLSATLCTLVVALDQSTKALVRGNLVPGEHVDVLGPLDLTLSHNRGLAFGLADSGGVGLVLITAVALAFVVALFARDPSRPWMWIAVGLVSGGALGNLIDRVRAGEVTDYVDLSRWPPFNLADMAIVAGVVLLAAIYLRERETQ
jgi:signal peptidase II